VVLGPAKAMALSMLFSGIVDLTSGERYLDHTFASDIVATSLLSPHVRWASPHRSRSNYAVTESCVRSFTLSLASGLVGSCNTVACWPWHSRVSNTTCPSGNSNAS
jgi:hypothetical protein